MLTKEERKAIAERLRSTYYITNSTLFKALTGEEELIENDQVKELCVIGRVIFDLCDTSNMLELPVDKDGEVIHVGDIVYYGSTIYMVKKIIYNGNEWEIQFFDNKLCTSIYAEPNDLTRKKPVTITSINEQLRHVLDKGHMSSWSMAKLFDIADQLESLGDNDAN